MKLITRQTKTKQAQRRWYDHYGPFEGKNASIWAGTDKEEVHKKLVALGDNPSPDEVDAAIGNDSWTSPGSCDECGSEDSPIVHLGQEPDYESNTAWVCEACLIDSLGLIRQRGEDTPTKIYPLERWASHMVSTLNGDATPLHDARCSKCLRWSAVSGPYEPTCRLCGFNGEDEAPQ